MAPRPALIGSLRLLVPALAAVGLLLGGGVTAPRGVAAMTPVIDPDGTCWNFGSNSVWDLSGEATVATDDFIQRDSAPAINWQPDPTGSGEIDIPALEILKNDRDALSDDSNALKPHTEVKLITQPGHASAFTLFPNGEADYTPQDGYYGPDSFQYVWYRTGFCSDVATVTISGSDWPRLQNDEWRVDPVPQVQVGGPPPPFTPGGACNSYTTPTGEWRFFDLIINPVLCGFLYNDRNVGMPLNLIGRSTPNVASTGEPPEIPFRTGHGIVTIHSNGLFEYLPDPGYLGDDAFYYESDTSDFHTFGYGPVEDTSGQGVGKIFAKVTLHVAPPPQAEAVDDGPFTVDEDTSLQIGPFGLVANDLNASDVASVQRLDQSFQRPPTVRTAHGTLAITWFSQLNSGVWRVDDLVYTPDPDYFGPDSFIYKARLQGVSTDLGVVAIDVKGVDDAPRPGADAVQTVMGRDITFNPVANDTDPDGDLDPSSFHLVGGADMTQNADGTVTLDAPAGVWGARIGQYTVADKRGVAAIGFITVVIRPLIGDTYSVDEDDVLDVAGPGVRANDATPIPDDVQVVVGDQPAHGTLDLAPTGAFTYTPDRDYEGPDSFTYFTTGGPGGYSFPTSRATVSITVKAVPDAPAIAFNARCGILCPSNFDDMETDEGGQVQLRGYVLDPDRGFSGTLHVDWGDGTTEDLVYPCAPGDVEPAPCTTKIWFDPTWTGPTIRNDRVYFDLHHLYADDPPGDTTRYTVSLTPSDPIFTPGPTTTTATVNNVPPTLTLSGDCGDLCLGLRSDLTIPAGGTATLRGRVTDPGADSVQLHVDWGDLTGGLFPQTCGVTGACPTTSIHAQNSCDPPNPFGPFTAVCGYYSVTHNFSTPGIYPVTIFGADGDGGTSAGLNTTITVTRPNVAPVAADDDYQVFEDFTRTVGSAFSVLLNDTDGDLATEPTEALTAVKLTNPTKGTVTAFNSDGTFTYQPNANAFGPDSFTYEACDTLDACSTATISLDITPAPDAPTALDNGYETTEDTALVLPAPGVLGNDADVDGEALTATNASDPAGGSVTLAADGAFTYTPNPDFAGEDMFTYQACDPTNRCAPAEVDIFVEPVNDPPVAADDAYDAVEGETLTIDAPGLLANDHDVETNQDQLFVELVAGPTGGTFDFPGDGSFTYTPALGTTGEVTFTYRTSDDKLESNVATVRIQVAVAARPPVTTNDTYDGTEDTLLSVPAPGVLANDADPNHDPITASLASGPAKGTLTLHADGSFAYSPNANAHGADSFTYRASDGALLTEVATVTIVIASVNDAPTADADSYSTNEDTALVVTAANGVLNGDADVDGDPISAVLVSGPSHGTLTLHANGSFTYTPAGNYGGPDSFTYRASDGGLSSPVATVSLTVSSVNDLPTIQVAGGSCLSDTDAKGSIVLQVGDVEAPAGSLTLSAVRSDTKLLPNGSVVFSGSGATRTATISAGAKQTGKATVTVTVSDGALTAQVVITVTVGGAKNDTLTGVAGTDLMFGLAGANTLVGGPTGETAIDVLCGGSGGDTLRGGGGNDVLYGGNGADVVEGGDDNDELWGGGGIDTLRGQGGDDTLRGQGGGDSFSGGAGTDTYADFTASEGDSVVDPAP
jgi:VCBS repeat-containing protein